MISPITLIPLTTVPLIEAGQDLGAILIDAMAREGVTLQDDDVVVLAQKIVSKAEDCFVALSTVTPSPDAIALANKVDKDPRMVEVILWDTASVVRAKPGVLITEHKLGFISANAGLDHSNVAPREEDIVLRLPVDPDKSSRQLRARFKALAKVDPAVLIIDSHGRAWRIGTMGVTIGLSGIQPVQDMRGEPDLFGTPLEYTDVGQTDQLAAAASLVMGQANEGCPAVIVRGYTYQKDEDARAADVLRPADKDMFR